MFFSMAYSKGGRWEHLNTDWVDFVAFQFPFLNTSFAIAFLLKQWKHEDERPKVFNKFFQIKK